MRLGNNFELFTYIIRLPQFFLSVRELAKLSQWTLVILEVVLAECSLVFLFVNRLWLQRAADDLARRVVKISGATLCVEALCFVSAFLDVLSVVESVVVSI